MAAAQTTKQNSTSTKTEYVVIGAYTRDTKKFDKINFAIQHFNKLGKRTHHTTFLRIVQNGKVQCPNFMFTSPYLPKVTEGYVRLKTNWRNRLTGERWIKKEQS